ncbi:MAG TPA: hypothetical protein VFJ16_27490 [Longimicrobium sp.]|nr:hypothetical protein [Longimicrobium sp.]
MPGYLLHQGATVICAHPAGQATPTAPFPRVKVAGQAVAVQPIPWAVTGCLNPPVSGGPCATASFVTAAVRVKAGGMPVLLQDSQAICAPTGTPLTALVVQPRVKGQ